MTRCIQAVVGLTAMLLNIVAIIYFVRWFAQTDFMFGHKKGPPGYILTALWLALIGLIAMIAWFLIVLNEKLASRRSTTVKSASSRLTLLQGITLVVLLLPVCLIVRIGVAEFPEARIKLQTDRMKSEAATPVELIKGLKSPNWRIRSAAARALGLRKERIAVEALIECLRDQNEPADVRTCAAQALARIEDPRAMKPLLEGLDDESYMVRVWAASGLATIGDMSCIPVLQNLARTDSGNRKRIERAIEAIRKREGSEQ